MKTLSTLEKGITGFHPETPDEKLLVSNSESGDFLSWRGNQGIARSSENPLHNFLKRNWSAKPTQARPKLDAAMAKKRPFGMETNLEVLLYCKSSALSMLSSRERSRPG
jgi:hypothetical protein